MAIHARLWFTFPFQAILATLIMLFSPTDQMEAASKRAMVRRYPFTFDPKMPMSSLLPTPPFAEVVFPPATNTDLTKVPELTFGELIVRKDESTEKAMARVLAKINHASKDDREAFMKSLIVSRPDLAGLPFRMGKDCETDEKSAALFGNAARLIHELRFMEDRTGRGVPKPNPAFWSVLRTGLPVLKGGDEQLRNPERDMNAKAVIAALMQILSVGSIDEQTKFLQHLEKMSHPEAAKALAKLAVFSTEQAVNAAAIERLKSRDWNEYDDVLRSALRYPLPSVARRATDVIVATKNKMKLSDLVSMLEQPDPRAPVKAEQAFVANELVRINHHRNCVLCHSPANVAGRPAGSLAVAVPLPDEAFPSPSQGGYRFGNSPDIFVRTDVTYLRQDFSMMMKVNDAKPWPEMQRFDFLVHTRKVTPEEAALRVKELAREPSPYHAAAQYALRELTGRQPADASAAGWRRVLGMGKD